MAKIGGYEFADFSVPLVFEERYFIMEPGNPPLMTVMLNVKGEPVFEILKNRPIENDTSNTTSNALGVLTVSDKTSGKLFYKIRPDTETSITFGKLDGGECCAVISDEEIRLGGMVVKNKLFRNSLAGVVVDPEIGMGMIDVPLPQVVEQWLS